MRLVLQQDFPLGRFHATPWRVNPFDDPFGEWPPSPWRFVRAVVARWYQWRREAGDTADIAHLDELVRALCTSSYCFHLPVNARKGRPLRQYHPTKLVLHPANNKKGTIPQLREYATSLVQDNYWCVPPGEIGAVRWFLSGELWTPQLVAVLDQCLERLLYFGRAETFTLMRRVNGPSPEPNCKPIERAVSSTSAPVLVPLPDATRADVERVTDDPLLQRSIPPGTRIMYADLPARPPIREIPAVSPVRADCRLIQIAIGWNVAPEPRAVVRLTSRFRSAVLNELLRIKTGNKNGAWSAAPLSVRQALADMLGKDADGKPFGDHSHSEFHCWWENRTPTRLLVWRGSRPFDLDEQTAILRAASRPFSWAAAGPDAAEWKVRLIPLDESVPGPPGFDHESRRVWESLTPFVPPRHHLRGAKPRPSESIPMQVRRELALRGVPGAEAVEIDEIGDAAWVAIHVPRRLASERAFLGDRRGYWLRLKFKEPVSGPLRLGHSSSFGLGLFAPPPERS